MKFASDDFIEPEVPEFSRSKSLKEEDFEPEVYIRPEWKKKIERLLENWWTVGLMLVVTIYALFFDDCRIIFLPPSADLTCDWVTLICILLYTIELVLASIAIDGYFFSFFFWLDLVAALSMIPDVGFLVSAYEGSK